MALDRTWFNTLVDDSGSGTDGTIWNKAQIDNLLDVVDAGFAAGGALTVIANSDTGTIDNWAPGISGNTYIRWTGAANLTVNSLAGGTLGQMVTIVCAGTGNMYFLQWTSTSGITGGKFINRVTSAPTPVSARGSVTYIYADIGGEYGWVLIAHEQGAAITAPFSAANFQGGGGAWTVEAGDVSTFKYVLQGRLLTLQIKLGGTSMAAGVTSLAIQNAAYGGYRWAAGTAIRLGQLVDGGTFAPGYFYVDTPPPYDAALVIYKDASATFTVSSNATHVQGVVTAEVV